MRGPAAAFPAGARASGALLRRRRGGGESGRGRRPVASEGDDAGADHALSINQIQLMSNLFLMTGFIGFNNLLGLIIERTVNTLLVLSSE